MNVPIPQLQLASLSDEGPQKWPHVILQVFLYVDESFQNHWRQDAVLLGEAAAPPLETLAGGGQALRLPLHALSHRPPQNTTSYETWFDGDRKVQVQAVENSAREDAEIMTRKVETHRLLDESSRDLQLKSLQDDLQATFPSRKIPDLLADISCPCNETSSALSTPRPSARTDISTIPPSGIVTPPPVSPPRHRSFTSVGANCIPSDAKKDNQCSLPRLHIADASGETPRMTPLRVSSMLKVAQNSVDAKQPSKKDRRGWLDVDLSWSVKGGAVSSQEERGILFIRLHSALVPTCLEGRLCVRVCQLESISANEEHASPKSNGHIRALPADGDVAESHFESLPLSYPVWMSTPATVGTKGSHFAEWHETASIEIEQSFHIATARRYESLSNTLRDICPPPCKPSRPPAPRKASAAWKPVQLSAQKPMPRCWERMEQSAFFEAPVPNPGSCSPQRDRSRDEPDVYILNISSPSSKTMSSRNR